MRVAVALSGGVDSAVTAARVVEAGHEAMGVHLLLGAGSVPETRDARAVADAVGIRLVVWDLRDRFEDRVLDYFTTSYAAGRTPNPCLRCNREVKFRGLLSRGIAEGFDAVATGHYARLEPAPDGSIGLHRAANTRKDQSYVLGVLSQDDLRHCLFPLGTVTTKDEVREEAERRGLPVAHKPDSTDICFVTQGGAAEFLADRLADRQGDIVDARGTVLGTHHGIQHFTVGQRKGLGLRRPADDGKPRYVTALDAATNTVHVGQGRELLVGQVDVEDLSDTGMPLGPHWRGLVQFRAHGRAVPARLEEADGQLRVHFAEPVSGVAPGQFIVFYDADRVRGAAEIVASHAPGPSMAPEHE
ncbi:MAG: tRNA 2-thiouridine(34) synthase MnmA [Propionibacterium freudenreichii]